MAALLRALTFLLLLATPILAADTTTVDVIGIMMEFLPDGVDDQTTGTGVFGSSAAYRLDNLPHDRAYFQKHLEFAKNYFARASNGRLVIHYAVVDTVWQPPRQHLYVDHQMRHYRVPAKKPSESNDEYYFRLNQGLMAFAGDALRRAKEKGLLDTSFQQGAVGMKRNRTIVVIFHAGASGLTDGGGMGSLYANTPGDIIDSYIWATDFRDYNGTSYNDDDTVITLAFDKNPADNTYGIFSRDSSNFVQQLLIVSETASQDSLNFGVNGILVNQLARALGLPDLWDTQKGVSAVGGYCLMDVGGYNSVYGFVPILPSAWCRVKLGWADPVVAIPSDSLTWTGTLKTALSGDPAGTIIKVPLSSTEYYLIENRQYLLQDSAQYRLTTDQRVYSYDPYDTIYGPWARMVIDSVCVAVNADSTQCTRYDRNPDSNKTRGVVTDCNSLDIGLPGYGVLIWHIDETVIREKLARDGVNDNINRRGVRLEEADGIEDLGNTEFVNIFGEMSQTYGGPQDFFPHTELRTGQYINQLTPYKSGTPNSHTDRFFSTHTNTGGYTGITVTIDTVAGATRTRDYLTVGANGVNVSEPVRIYGADAFQVKVQWVAPQGVWPQPVDTGRAIAAEAVRVDSVIYCVTDSGDIAAYGAHGGLFRRDSTLRVSGYRRLSTPSVSDSFLYFASSSSTAPASRFLHRYNTRNATDTVLAAIVGDSLSTLISVYHRASIDTLYFGTYSGKIHATVLGFDTSVALPLGKPVTALGLDSVSLFAVANSTLYRLNRVSLRVMNSHMLSPLTGDIRLALGDIARAVLGREIVLNDAAGNVILLDSALNPLPGWPVKIDAAGAISPSLGDVDNDGSLDIVISADNKIYALNYSGTSLTGWPYTAAKREPAGAFRSPAVLTDLDGDGAMELFVPAPNDNILVIDNNGQTYEFAAGVRVAGLSLPFGGVSGLSCTAADLDVDSAAGVPEHIEVFTENGAGWLACFNVPLNGAENTAWATNGGTLARTFAYTAALPALRATAAGLSVDTLFTYPNPVKGPSVTVKYRLSAAASQVRCKLFNAAGDKVLEKSGWPSGALWNHAALDVGRLAPGLYTLKLEATVNGQTRFKFTKVGVWK